LQAELAQLQTQPPWTVLGISQGADEATARKAFHEASKRYHPHSFARYSMPEIKAVVTQLFIVYKRAFTAMTKAGRGGRNGAPAAGSGNPPVRSSDPGNR
jgi:preprotein translocase subunit Sec63